MDDEPEIAEALREIVAPLAARVDTAATGAAALKRIDAFTYDLLLTDLRMPELDGHGLYAALRERDPGAAPKIIFVTGDSLDGTVRDFIAGTGLPVLGKPFTPSEVRRVVTEALADKAVPGRGKTVKARGRPAKKGSRRHAPSG